MQVSIKITCYTYVSYEVQVISYEIWKKWYNWDFDNLYILSAFVYYSHQPPKKSVLRNFRLRNQYYVTYFTYETGAT